MRQKLLFLTLALFCLVGRVWAEATNQGSLTITYDTGNNTASVKALNTNITGSIAIPSTVTIQGAAYKVVTIEAGAFYGCKSITSVSIPATVTTIMRGAFTGCDGLKTLRLEDSKEPVYFDNDYYVYPNGNDEFCKASLDVFYQGRDINVAVADKRIVTSAKKIELGKYTTFVPKYYSYDNTALEELIIAGSSSVIGESAFNGCSSLTKFTLTAPIERFENEAFRRCSLMTNFTMPASASFIGKGAFYNCKALTSVTIPANVGTIERGAFTGCDGLKTLRLEDSENYLYFDNNYGVYPNGNDEFCRASLDVFYQGRDIVVSAADKKIVTSAKKIEMGGSVSYVPKYYSYDNADLTELIIAGNSSVISENAFDGCSNLTKFTLTAPIERFENEAFRGCSLMTNFTMPASTNFIGKGAFYNCKALTSVTIPANVGTIERGAFTGCDGLKTLRLEDSENHLFFDNNYGVYPNGNDEFCRASLDVFYQGRDISVTAVDKKIVTSAKKIEMGGSVSYVPVNYTASNSALAELIINANVESIGRCAFESCTSLDKVSINAPVKTIEREAFYYCKSLTAFDMPKTVEFIGRGCFRYCELLASVNIPAATSTIERGAFTSCPALKTFVIEDATAPLFFDNAYDVYPNGNDELCKASLDAFYQGRDIIVSSPDRQIVTSAKKIEMGGSVSYVPVNYTASNSALAELIINANVESIGRCAFESCTSLAKVSINAPVKTIEREAFYNCKSLTAFDMPKTVEFIGRGCFRYCELLASVNIPAATSTIERGAFTSCPALKTFVLEDATAPLFFDNAYDVYTNGNDELCTNALDKVYFGRNVTTSADVAIFRSVKELTFGKMLTSIDNSFSKISDIQKVIVPWTKPITIDAGIFSANTYSTAVLFVPGGTMAAYKADPVWSKFTHMEAASYYVNASATKGGTLSFGSTTVAGGSSKSVLVDRETAVAFKAQADENYDLTSLTVDGTQVAVSGGAYTYPSLLKDITVKATFTEKPQFDVKATATGGTVSLNGGTMSASASIRLYRDKDVTINIKPSEGHKLDKVTVNGVDYTAKVKDNAFTVSNIQGAQTIVVTFVKFKYNITKAATQNGTIELSKTVVEWGDSFTATFKPATGYLFATASVNGTDVTSQVKSGVLTVSNVREAKTIGATFKKQTYAVTISGAGVSVSNAKPQYGDNVTVTIENDPDRQLTKLLVNGTDVTSQVKNGQYVIQNVSGNVTIEASFKSTKEFITLSTDMATFSCTQDLDFSSSDLAAYIVAGYNKATGQVLLTRVVDVPANTGIVVVGEAGKTYKVPYAQTASYYVNLLKANIAKSTVAATTGTYSNYILSGDSFSPISSSATLLAQTAYLQLPTSFVAAGARVSILFEEDLIDGIEDFRMDDTNADEAIYDLSGRKLQKVQKGINIIGGKKVMMK